MPTKVTVQERQFVDIDKITFADVHRHFHECHDLLFVIKDAKITGILTSRLCMEAADNGTHPGSRIDDIVWSNFVFLYDDQLDQAELIFEKEGLFQVPVFNRNDKLEFVLYKSDHSYDQTFHCDCLSDQSHSSFRNLSINADLTVSCNFWIREMGKLGDMKKDTLHDIFHSEYVNHIRKRFSEGYVSSVKCIRCPDLIPAPREVCEYYITNYSFPKDILIENTSDCNLKCRDCWNLVIKRDTISEEDFEKIAIQLAENGVEYVDLHKFGEPFCDKDIGQKINILRQYLPERSKIVTSTNGMLLGDDWAINAAMDLDCILISLFGLNDEMLSKYQIGSCFQTVYANMTNIIRIRNSKKKSTPMVAWKFPLFEWTRYDEIIEKVFELALAVGVDQLHFMTPWGPVDPLVNDYVQNSSSLSRYRHVYSNIHVPWLSSYEIFHLNKM